MTKDLHRALLRQELQREIEEAKKLEKSGKHKDAGEHYLRASAIYRRIAYDAPVAKAEEMFDMANQYEGFSKVLVNKAKIKRIKEAPEDEKDELIDSLIVSQKPDVDWDHIGGLEDLKQEIKEAIVLPFVRGKPMYVKAPRTILLYGPPGTGKTLLAKASCSTLNATFFEARISNLLSKYFGESNKLINALFPLFVLLNTLLLGRWFNLGKCFLETLFRDWSVTQGIAFQFSNS